MGSTTPHRAIASQETRQIPRRQPPNAATHRILILLPLVLLGCLVLAKLSQGKPMFVSVGLAFDFPRKHRAVYLGVSSHEEKGVSSTPTNKPD